MVALGVALSPAVAASQSADFYAGKTLQIIVGLEAGGTVDTLARLLAASAPAYPGSEHHRSEHARRRRLGRHQFLQERAAPDGLTILYGPWDPLAQALGDQGLRARYQDLDYLGGTGDIRVNYARADAAAGGIKSPRDIVRADGVILGALNKSDISGLLPHLVLDVLGVKHKMVVGYRGGNDVFLAMQRGEVQFHSTSISTFRSRNGDFIKSGKDRHRYLVPVDRDGGYACSPLCGRDARLRISSRRSLAACRPVGLGRAQLAHQPGRRDDLCGLRARGTPAGGRALRKGFADASSDRISSPRP